MFGVRCWMFPNSLLPVPRHETMILRFQVGGALLGKEMPVNARVADHHFEPFLKWAVGHYLTIFHVGVFREGNSIWQRPGITLPSDGAKLVRGRQPFFVRSHHRHEKFSGEFMPEMVEKIFQRAADAAVIIRRAENEDVGFVHAFLQGLKFRRVVGSVRIVKRERLILEIQQIHCVSVRAHFLGNVMNHDSRDGFAVQTARDSEHVQGRF